MPLAGGTLTGALTGTTSIWNGFAIGNTPTSVGTSAIVTRYLSAGSDWYIGSESSVAGAFYAGASAYASVFFGTNPFQFITGGTKRFEIATGGITSTVGITGTSATFSSSVQSTDFRYTGSGYLTYNTGVGVVETFTLRNNGTPVLTLDSSSRATFANTVFVGGNLFFDANATIKTISNYGYGGAVQLLRSDANTTRWARIGMVDATATNFLGGMTINNDTSATFSGNISTGGYIQVNGGSNGYLNLNATSTGGNESGIFFQVGGANKWENYTANNDTALNWYSYANSTIVFKLASTGAATFSSSVDAVYLNANNSLRIRKNTATGGNNDLGIFYSNTGDVFNFYDWNTATKGMSLNTGTGAATFSSSVTVGNAINLSNNNVFPTDAGIFQGNNFIQIVSGTGGFTVNNNANLISNLVITNAGAATFSSSVLSTQYQVDNSGTAELRLRGGGYGGSYNTSLRSIAGAIGILQLGNNADNYILVGNTSANGYLSIRVNCASESTSAGIEALRITASGTVQPGANGTQDLGTSSLRWATVYTSDLSLSNGIGDYTIVEGENDLFLYNNKQNKVYKFMLAEVDPADATPKKSN